jgi:hypothetical protein
LSLDVDGRWHFGTRLVENERVQELFHAGVEVRPDGDVVLRVGKMWCYVKCSGPAFFIRRFDWERGEVELAGGRRLKCEPVRIGWGPDDRLYLWLGSLPGPAICLRAAHQDAIARFRWRDNAPSLACDAERAWPIEVLETSPRASTGARSGPPKCESA